MGPDRPLHEHGDGRLASITSRALSCLPVAVAQEDVLVVRDGWWRSRGAARSQMDLVARLS